MKSTQTHRCRLFITVKNRTTIRILMRKAKQSKRKTEAKTINLMPLQKQRARITEHCEIIMFQQDVRAYRAGSCYNNKRHSRKITVIH